MPIKEVETMGLTTSCAARVLGVSAQTVNAWAAAGILHPVRSAGGWRYYDPREVDRVAKQRQRMFRS